MGDKQPPARSLEAVSLATKATLADPHGPNRLGDYVRVHESYMANFLAEGFVVDDECDFTFLRHAVFLDGTIYCLGGIQAEVEKTIAILHAAK